MMALPKDLFSTRNSKTTFTFVILFRCLFFIFAIFSLNHFIALGTAPSVLSLAAIVGTIIASLLSFSKLKILGLLLGSGLIYGAFHLAVALYEILPSFSTQYVFSAYNIIVHANLVFLAFGAAVLSSWFFWRQRHALTAEILLIAAAVVYFLAGHRAYHFDTPKIVNTMAWTFGIDNLSMLLTIGASAVLVLFLYVFIATLPSCPRAFGGGQALQAHIKIQRTMALIMSALLVVFIVLFIAQQIYLHYHQIVITRTANGVGQMVDAGLSPLGWHSAVGTSNQPAALVRLEGDYAKNPFSPMLYLREDALSEFDSQEFEFVIASGAYDDDVAYASPKENYKAQEQVEAPDRIPLEQSIFLLANHKKAFAVDYPIEIKRLKNPVPGRFKSAYKAYSLAPTYSLKMLKELSVGNPDWQEDERQHYLKAHPDPRYAELAISIAYNDSSPIAKALSLTDYLSKNAIYTLTPNHEPDPKDDNTAPFLFGDLRGYCVHFSHALVYMMRSLGIPSRIGTGYLTDLSQSKDGHILLRMSDRHAWAEVYVHPKGWVPFDVQPDQVESHAELNVDMKLLEELMAMVGPSEEILPEDILDGEPNIEEESVFYVPRAKDLISLVLIILVSLSLIKLYLRFSWLMPSSTSVNLRRTYIAISSLLYDLGYRRQKGETRCEFKQRLEQELDLSLLKFTDVLNFSNYAKDPKEALKEKDFSTLYKQDFQAIQTVSFTRRLLATLNPASVFATISGRRW